MDCLGAYPMGEISLSFHPYGRIRLNRLMSSEINMSF